jgi:tetratricopeptide (TPR) repeat protein
LFISLNFSSIAAGAFAAEWERFVEFRDTVKPDTVPAVLVHQGKIKVQAWTPDERTKTKGYINKVYRILPGLFRIGASQGPVPFYRINMGSSFGGHGSLWLSYMNSAVIAHELTHVADAEHKIARSVEFRRLVEPRIRNLRAVMKKNGFTDPLSGEAAKRTDLIFASGMPSFYAANTIQEALAEYVRASAMNKKFTTPPDIKAFLDQHILRAEPVADPSVPLYRQGKAARLKGDLNTAYAKLSAAIKHDVKFAESYIERGLTLMKAKRYKFAADDFTRALGLMSEYDWQLYIPYYRRGLALATSGQYEKGYADLLVAKRLAPKTPGLTKSLGQVKYLIDMNKKMQKTKK